MTVRMRVVAAFATVALPFVVLLFVLSRDAQREAQLGATYAAVVARMDGGGRERCEQSPERFGRSFARKTRGRRGAVLLGPELHTYDVDFRARSGGPAISPSLRDALLSGEEIAREEIDGRHEGIAMRMPWREGPCAVLYTIRPLPPQGQRALRAIAVPLAVLLVALAVALIALGPPLSRLKVLAEAVSKPEIDDRALRGVAKARDETGEVARALGDAARSLRAQVEALEERDRALHEFVAGTTHDLAIPMTVLAGHLAEAEERARRGEPTDAATLSNALTECHYATQLLSNLAAATKLERAPALGKTDGAVDLNAIAERVFFRHRSLARARDTALDFAVPEERLETRGDETLLERAIGNLVHNAIRHAERSTTGPGEDSSGHVALILERTGDRFRVTVADDGANVDDALAAQLAVGTPDSPARTRGRGLGLRIVRRVAELHGLTLRFEAEGGLRVTLEGPLVRTLG